MPPQRTIIKLKNKKDAFLGVRSTIEKTNALPKHQEPPRKRGEIPMPKAQPNPLDSESEDEMESIRADVPRGIPIRDSDVPPIVIDGHATQKLAMRIKQFKAAFPKEFEKIDEDELDHLSHDQLQKKLDDMKFILRCTSNIGILSGGITMAARLAENMSIGTPYPLSGLGAQLDRDAEYQKILMELDLEYGNFVEIGPEGRCFFKLMKTATDRYHENKISEIVNENKKPVSKEDLQAFSNL